MNTYVFSAEFCISIIYFIIVVNGNQWSKNCLCTLKCFESTRCKVSSKILGLVWRDCLKNFQSMFQFEFSTP